MEFILVLEMVRVLRKYIKGSKIIMYKYEDCRFINAGQNEIHRWGKKAKAKAKLYLKPENGYYNIPVDGGKYWSIGTSTGKYGEFAKVKGYFFSVNSAGNMYAKEGTEKGKKFVEAVTFLIQEMERISSEKYNESHKNDDEDEDD